LSHSYDYAQKQENQEELHCNSKFVLYLFLFGFMSTLAASAAATTQGSLWEKALETRIHLQRVVDIANKFPSSLPANQSIPMTAACNLQSMLTDLMEAVDFSTQEKDRSKKRARDSLYTKEQVQSLSNEITRMQATSLPKWKSSIEKLHSREHFGSDNAKSKLKVFNQSIWTHVSSLTRIFIFV